MKIVIELKDTATLDRIYKLCKEIEKLKVSYENVIFSIRKE